MKKNVLITGGGGFLGQALARKCVERGDRVWSLSRTIHPELTALGVVQIQGDVTRHMDVVNACKGKDFVFHLAVRKGNWGRLSQYYKTNVKGTRHVIDACRMAGVKALVYTSTTRVGMDSHGFHLNGDKQRYPEKFSTNFAMSKAFAEQAVLKAATGDLRCIVLRPHMIWGPGDRSVVPGLIRKRRWLLKIGNGKNRVSGIYIDNAADAHLLAADQLADDESLSGRVFILAEDEPIAMWDLIQKIESWTGRKRVYFTLPAGVTLHAGQAMECLYKFTGMKRSPCLTRSLVVELSKSHVFNAGDIETSLGFRPGVTHETGLERYRNWLENRRDKV